MEQCKLAGMPGAQFAISVGDLTEAISVQRVIITSATVRRKEYTSVLNLVFDTFLNIREQT